MVFMAYLKLKISISNSSLSHCTISEWFESTFIYMYIFYNHSATEMTLSWTSVWRWKLRTILNHHPNCHSVDVTQDISHISPCTWSITSWFLLFVFPFQRIEVFVRQNNFLDALELALSFYDGTAMAVIGGFTLAAQCSIFHSLFQLVNFVLV